MGLLERQKGREERDGSEERETEIFYIICWYNLYYFNKLYVNKEIGILVEL